VGEAAPLSVRDKNHKTNFCLCVSQCVCNKNAKQKRSNMFVVLLFFVMCTPKGCQRGRGTCSAKWGGGRWWVMGVAGTGTTKPLPNVIRRRSNDVPMRKRRMGTSGRVKRTEIKFFGYQYPKCIYTLIMIIGYSTLAF